MKPVAVTDATALIVLGRIGHLELLPRLFEPVLVPSWVWNEVVDPDERPGAAAVARAPWAVRTRVRQTALVQRLERRLGHEAGEVHAIALAHARTLRVLLDDDAAVGAARSLGLRVLRLPYLLYVARLRGALPGTLGDAFARMQSVGFFLPAVVEQDLLRRAGETA